MGHGPNIREARLNLLLYYPAAWAEDFTSVFSSKTARVMTYNLVRLCHPSMSHQVSKNTFPTCSLRMVGLISDQDLP